MSGDDAGRQERCRSLLDRARGYLDDAEMLTASGSLSSAVNRCYYAAHAAARALLALRGIEPGSHEGLIGAVRAELVGPAAQVAGRDPLPDGPAEALQALLSRRIIADYGDGIVGAAMAADSLELARGFVQWAIKAGTPP
jgi:uncharacterized protein (UPF0332 family)